jgi:MATE family multidrug resistance protein
LLKLIVDLQNMSSSQATPSLQVNISSKQILAISLPIALAILVPQINFVINNIFLGALSEQALAIGGITGVFYLIFGVMGQGLNNGLQALISRRAGENRVDEIGILFSQGVIISIALSVIGISFTYFVVPSIFHSLLQDQERANTVIEFLKIRIWGLPFCLFTKCVMPYW